MFPLLFPFFFLLILIVSRFTHRPGNTPPSYPIIGCLIAFYQNRGQLLSWYTGLLSESPTQTIIIQRLGATRTLVTANPSNVEYMLKTNFHNFPKGEPFSDLLGDLLGTGIFNVDGELWSAQRKLASHEFSTKSLREFVVKTLEKEVEQRLLPLLEMAAEKKYVLDMQEVLKRFTFETICKVSLGFDPCCINQLPDLPLPPLFQAFDTASMISAMRATSPMIIIWKIKRAFNLGTEKKLKESTTIIHDTVKSIIYSKKEKFNIDLRIGKEEYDLLSRLILAGHDEKLIRDMVISLIMAGRDTTSSAMTWLFWLLSQNPDTENNVIKEVELLKKGDAKTSIETYDDLKEMNYLKACLCESMRLYPPVAWDSKHAVINDVLPDGTKVWKGDRVTYFPYGMGRMKELWGEDRFDFKPERWLDENGAFESVCPFKYPVFQGGPRVCLGKEMAFIQMKYVVASILKRFEIKPVNSDQPVFMPLLTAHMAGGFKVIVQKRSGLRD